MYTPPSFARLFDFSSFWTWNMQKIFLGTKIDYKHLKVRVWFFEEPVWASEAPLWGGGLRGPTGNSKHYSYQIENYFAYYWIHGPSWDYRLLLIALINDFRNILSKNVWLDPYKIIILKRYHNIRFFLFYVWHRPTPFASLQLHKIPRAAAWTSSLYKCLIRF